MGLVTTPDDIAALSLRRMPTQARSLEKVSRLLTAADKILAAEGLEALTTSRVALEAGMSVGALYQYLPDREAIIEALASRYLRELESVMDFYIDESDTIKWEDPAGVLVQAFAGIYREHAGLRALWFARDISETIRDNDRKHQRVMAESLGQVLAKQTGIELTEEISLKYYVAFLAADCIMQEAFRISPAGDPLLLANLEELMRAFLQGII
ncbi:MAG: TetR/AcrR family transcriptional regulator [Mycobacteriaceae bacterium]